jgi:ubiquinone/menaquinone biosynthesis C-methylase UbiE
MEEFVNPENILEIINPKADILAAEFGCGSGGFTIPLAKKIEEGLVFALDIQEPALIALKGRANLARISNIKTIRCDLEKPKGSTLQDSYLDLVLAPNLLFQVEDKKTVISEAKRVLKSRGLFVIIDWEENSNMGLKQKYFSKDEAKKMCADAALVLEKEFKAGSCHYCLIFKKP